MSHVVVCPPWRHFVSEAPDLSVEGLKNSFVDIELRKYQKQGTHPVDKPLLDEKHFQGGYLLNFLIKTPPKHGKVITSPSGRGFRYKPSYGYVGPDDFYYVLNNGSQNSNVGKVTIDIKDGLDGSIRVSRLRPTTNTKNMVLKFVGKYKIPDTWPITYDFIQMSLIETIPIVGYMNMLPYVFDTPYTYMYTPVSYGRFYVPYSTATTITSPWKLYSLPYMVDGYWPYTQQPYPKPIYKPWPMALTIDFYKSPVIGPWFLGFDINDNPMYEDRFYYWQLHHSITIDVESVLGSDWYENGTVQWVKFGDSGWPVDLFPDGL